MSAQERAAALRAQAESLDAIAELETAAAEAKAAYQADNTNPELRAAHREASQALADAREEMRQDPVVISSGDGSTSVMPQPVSGGVGRGA